MSSFTAEIYQNEFLAAGATEVDAVVTVTATGGRRAADRRGAAAAES